MSHIVALALSVILWPPMMIYRAYIITILWGWFVLPALKIEAPSIYVLGGLLIVLHLSLPFQRVSGKNDDGPIETMLTSAVLYGILAPSSILLFGWIWRWLQWGVA